MSLGAFEERALRGHKHERGHKHDLHRISRWLAPSVAVSPLYFGYHDSDPGKDWNPSYTFAGRSSKPGQAGQDQVQFSQAARQQFEQVLRRGEARRVPERIEVFYMLNATSTISTSRVVRGQRNRQQQPPSVPEPSRLPSASASMRTLVDGGPTVSMEFDLDDVVRPISPWCTTAEINVSAAAVCFVYAPSGGVRPYALCERWPVRVNTSRGAIVWGGRSADDGHELSLYDREKEPGSRLVVSASVA